MLVSRLATSTIRLVASARNLEVSRQMATHFRSGAIKAKPQEMPFGIVGVVCAVVPGE